MLLRCLEKVRCLKTCSLNLLSRTCKLKRFFLTLCISALKQRKVKPNPFSRDVVLNKSWQLCRSCGFSWRSLSHLYLREPLLPAGDSCHLWAKKCSVLAVKSLSDLLGYELIANMIMQLICTVFMGFYN